MTRIVRVVGLAVMAIALVFLGRELSANWPTIRAWRPGPGEIALLGALAAVYGLAQFLLAEAWHRIVGIFGTEPRARTYFSFTVSIVARYLPGNVAHLLGRALYLRGGSLGDGALARATLTELCTTPAGAILILAVLAPFLPGDVLGPWPEAVRMALMLAPVGLVLGWLALRHLTANLPTLSEIGAPILYAAAFMAVLGGVFAKIAGIVVDVPLLPAAAAAILAWLLGYATPGAPGGLGTREAALVLLLGLLASEAELLLAAGAFRLATTLGELACFWAGWPVRRRLVAR